MPEHVEPVGGRPPLQVVVVPVAPGGGAQDLRAGRGACRDVKDLFSSGALSKDAAVIPHVEKKKMFVLVVLFPFIFFSFHRNHKKKKWKVIRVRNKGGVDG